MVYYDRNEAPTDKPMWVCAFQASRRKIQPLKNLKPSFGEFKHYGYCTRFYIYNKQGKISQKHYDLSGDGYAICDTKEECEDEYNMFVKSVLYDIEQLKEKYQGYIIPNYKSN